MTPSPEDLVRVARPGVALHRRPGRDDEVVLGGGEEVFRLPLAPSAVARQAVLVRALPKLVPLVPVAIAPPRYVGVLADGSTPFTAERRLPGVPWVAVPTDELPGGLDGGLDGIALGQLQGVVAALRAVPAREAAQWGVPGDPAAAGGGVLLHGALDRTALLTDPRSGLLTGVVDWDPRLGDAGESLVGALAAELSGLL